MVSSAWSRQQSQVAFVVIFLRKRFPLVGSESEQALRKKCLILFGMLSLQISVRKALLREEFEGPGLAAESDSARIR